MRDTNNTRLAAPHSSRCSALTSLDTHFARIMSAAPQVRHQKKNQTARQAMMISGLQTIYRNNATSNAIKRNIQSEARIYFLDITLDEINNKYAKIHQLVENGRLRPKGTETFFVKIYREHLLITERGVYEIKVETSTKDRSVVAAAQYLQQRFITDGETTTKEIHARIIEESNVQDICIPVLIDESYFSSSASASASASASSAPAPAPAAHLRHYTPHIPTEHTLVIRVKKTIRFHNNAPNAFVFIFDETEKTIVDFYMTTDNGILPNADKLNNSFKDDLISFLSQFKLCS